MNCTKCGTANDAGNKFCKECGQSLSETSGTTKLSADEHLKIGEFVYLAYKESEAGHVDSAITACTGALAINDANPGIHTLLASLYERKGDLARAIYEYERTVALNPGSLDDRRKLEQLRMQLISPASVGVRSKPRFRLSDIKWFDDPKALAPYAAFAIVFVIVVVMAGRMLLKPASKHIDSTGVGSQGTTQMATGPNDTYQMPTAPYGNPSGAAPNQSSATQQPGANPQQPAASGTQNGIPNASASADKPTKPGIPSVRLPGTATPAQPITRGQSKPPSPVAGTSTKPVITPIIRNGGTSLPPMNSSPIKPVPAKPSQPAKSAEERGMELQRMGKYDDAIGAYREALSQTSDPGRIYQHIGMSYQRKGQHDLAIDSYNRAIKAYRDQLASGRSQTEVQNGIRACEAGIEVSRNQR